MVLLVTGGLLFRKTQINLDYFNYSSYLCKQKYKRYERMAQISQVDGRLLPPGVVADGGGSGEYH
jgi:hypothetical protein